MPSDIVITNINKSFNSERVLNNFSLTLPFGKTTVLMGPSGCGKTTLLNILTGLVKPDSGTVTGVGNNVAVVFQENRLCEKMNAVQNIKLVCGNECSEGNIQALLKKLMLNAESIEKPVEKLSGGQKRRVAIARALLAKSDFICMDEPFKGLDDDTRKIVIDTVQQYTKQKTMLIITHDVNEAQFFDAVPIAMQALNVN